MEKMRTLSEIRTAILQGNLTLVELVKKYLDTIEKKSDLNLYIEVYGQEALEKAAKLDKQRLENPDTLGRLWGCVVSLKDVISYKGHELTAGSKILKGYTATFDATATERLLAEDAIVIGRVNCDEFAMGSSNERSEYGLTKNALNPALVPGGSSGASAASVQADTCLLSLGSDTGGSVRQPAAFNGVIGMKPSYGRISRHGLIAYASSFDQIGILGHHIPDIALMLEIISGSDEYDSTASQRVVPPFSEMLQPTGAKKIAIFKQTIENEGIEGEVLEATKQFVQQLEAKGHEIHYIDFEYLDYVIPAYYVMTTAEASSNLARFDGVRYGYRSDKGDSLRESYVATRTEGFGEEVQRRILLGTYVLSAGYYDAYFAKAQKIRRLIFDKLNEVFIDYDLIGLPTSPTPAWPIGSIIDDPVKNYLADIYTVTANLAGMPALSVPTGLHSNGSGIGFQFIGNKFEEANLLAFAGTL